MMKGDMKHGLIGAAIGGLGGALAGGAIGNKIKHLNVFFLISCIYFFKSKKVSAFIVIK